MKKLSKVLVVASLCMVCLSFSMAGSVLAAPKAPKAIVIGAHLPLSGAGASLGQERLWAYQAAVEDINAAGGIYVKEFDTKLPVEFICFDDETDPAKAAAAVERLVKQRKVNFILGGESAPFGVIPGAITAEKYKVLYHTTSCVTPAWQEQQFAWSTLLWYEPTQGTSIPFPIWDKMKENGTSIDKPALFMEDTFDGRIMNETFKKNATAAGYNIAMEEYSIPGAKDYSAQILKAKALGIDAIILFANTSDCVTFVRQMKENDFSVKNLIGYKGTWAAEFYEATGKDGEFVMNDTLWHEAVPFAGNRELGARFKAKFGKDSTAVGLTYALAQILFQGIEKAGSLDSLAVRNAIIDGATYDTLIGPVTYDQTGLAIFALMAAQWESDGGQSLIYPFEWKTSEPKVIVPWKKRK